MFSGSSGVNPAYAIVAVFLILAWRNAGYLGLDRLAPPDDAQPASRSPHGHARGVSAARAGTGELTHRL
jgi:thiosulfate dehydrogenase [quinone] large subunit